MYNVDNAKIGPYLETLITEKYGHQSDFCRKYLEKTGTKPDGEPLRKMRNRVSQILKGKKAIQLDDIPVFTELLEISCEELLSAGEVRLPVSSRQTNYSVACSHDQTVWKQYAEREDKLILNYDEYGKSVLDYIFEFKNYPFLQFLMQEKYIWLTDNKGWDGMSYGAGTSIKRRDPGYTDSALPLQIQYEDRIRTETLALAVENSDRAMLDTLYARENPLLHNLAYLNSYNQRQYYNEDLVRAIAKADESILDYFTQEFRVEDSRKHANGCVTYYIFPFIGEVVDLMLSENRKETELPIRRILAHNKKVFDKLSELTDTAYRATKDYYSSISLELPEPELRRDILRNFTPYEQHNMIEYYYIGIKSAIPYFASNIVRITGKGHFPLLSELISQSNEYYDKIINFKGEPHGQHF